MAVSLLRTTHRKVLGAIVCDGYAMLAVAAACGFRPDSSRLSLNLDVVVDCRIRK